MEKQSCENCEFEYNCTLRFEKNGKPCACYKRCVEFGEKEKENK